MSKSTEQPSETDGSFLSVNDGESIAETFERLYHIPLLGALVAFMLWIRVQSYDNFIIDGEFFFTGNDPWYHFRETTYTVMNYPFTMPYDVWTRYPEGNLAGQFGTLWDQLVATAILIVGLGSPTETQAATVMLVATAVMAALCAIPTYYITRRFVSRPAALLSVFLLALMPGQFLTRSLVGSYQHHAAEAFFMSTAVLAMLVAVSVSERHKPVWELVVDRDLEGLRQPLIYSVLAGVATALYMYVWQPGVLIVGVFGVFFLIKITSDVVHDDTPEPIVFVGAVSLTVTGLLLIIPLEEFSFGVSDYSYTQIVLPIGVALGCVFLGYLARQFESRNIDPIKYPLAVGGILAATAVIMIVALPNLWSTLYGNFVSFIGFGASDWQGTIAEAQPLVSDGQGVGPIIREYGLTLFVAMAGLVGLVVAPLYKSGETNHSLYAFGGLAVIGLFVALPAIPALLFGFTGSWQVVALGIVTLLVIGATYQVRYSTEELLLVVWTGFLLAATFTQIRFSYYLVIPVVILNGIVVAKIISWADVSADSVTGVRETIKNIEGWQVMILSVVFLGIFVPGLIIPIEAAGSTGTAWQIGANSGPGAVTEWDDSFDWMQDDTPYPGELEGHDNRMDHYGTVENPGSGGYEYPEGSYGVMSWWDYGHWITVQGERIPYSNPFQNNADEAANYLLAPDEERSQQVIDRLNEPNDAEAQARYVMVDWEMATPGSKFGAPIIWYDEEDISRSDFLDQAYPVIQTEEGEQFGQPINLRSQRYYDSQMIRLYNYHGSAADPEPIVIETQERTVQTQGGQEVTVDAFDQESDVQTFDTIEEAEEYVEENPGAQIGGIGANPTERVDALENYRLVKASESSALSAGGFQQDLFGSAQSTGVGLEDLQARFQTGELDGVGDNPLLSTDPHWVKTFERIPGATVEGSGADPGEEISADVEMEIPETGETFTYTQYAEADSEGNFEMTLPYSSTGYDEFGPEEGYTNTTVQATGEYTFSSEPTTDDELTTTQRIDQAHVEEGQVIGVDDSVVTVELSEETVDEPEGAQTGDEAE